MCRILLIKDLQNWPIDNQLLEDLDYTQGGDGIGMGWFEEGTPKKVVVPISSTKHMVNAAVKHLTKLKESGIQKVLYHTRMTSRGAKNLENIHPFLINLGPPMNKKAWFCHNGTISTVGKIKDNNGEWSDTRTFAKMLNSLPWEIIKMNLEDNPYEVFVLLTQDGEFMKFQEKTYEGKTIVNAEGPIEHSPSRVVNNSSVIYNGYNACDHYRDDYYKNGRNFAPYSSNKGEIKKNLSGNLSGGAKGNGLDDDVSWHDAFY